MNREVRSGDFLLLIITAILWGISFLFIKVAVASLPPCTLVGLRLFLASLFLLCYVYGTGSKMPKPGRAWLPFLILGVTNCTAPYLLIAWGEIYIDSGLAAILGATMPLFTILFGHFVARSERMTGTKLAGLGVGLIGVILLIGPDAVNGLGVHIWAQMAMVLASACYASAAVYGSMLKGMKASVVTAGQVVAGLLTILPFMLAEAPWTLRPSGLSLLAVLGLALFGTAIPYVMYFHLLTAVGATNTSLVTYLIPMVGVMAGVFFLNEQVSMLSILSLFLILGGVAGVSGICPLKPLKKESIDQMIDDQGHIGKLYTPKNEQAEDETKG
ncbi:DMT family transporter [Candidatus Formimonas warabiya]|uniref:EamA domain-containing protein n=1 Tax=Formimonas warabiya TaxID=1761012 RepID=A0A3G1KRQ5_FORW1|nr:EamA family transporter [Candidatus Formimonas warabiya]ATW25149.1 hypothetical protein DCMF_10550 [Candidatus Formimonas warabiya]